MAKQRNVEENYAASWLIPGFDFDSADCAFWCQPSPVYRNAEERNNKFLSLNNDDDEEEE